MDLSRRLDRIETILSSLKCNTYTVYMIDGTERRVAPEDCITMILREPEAIRSIERPEEYQADDGMMLELLQGLLAV